MNNPYYHSFIPGFNAWYIVAVLGVILIAVVGYNMYYVHSGCMFKRYNRRFIGFMSFVFTAILMVMVVKESWRGLVQFLDNGLAYDDSPAWTMIGAPVALMILAGVYWSLLDHVGRRVALKKKRRIEYELKRWR